MKLQVYFSLQTQAAGQGECFCSMRLSRDTVPSTLLFHFEWTIETGFPCPHSSPQIGSNILWGISEDFVHITFSRSWEKPGHKAMPRCIGGQEGSIISWKALCSKKKKKITLEERENWGPQSNLQSRNWIQCNRNNGVSGKLALPQLG